MIAGTQVVATGRDSGRSRTVAAIVLFGVIAFAAAVAIYKKKNTA